jgi:hypothetical protein
MTSEHKIYNKHSWFVKPEKRNGNIMFRSQDAIPSDETHTSLVISENKSGITGLRFLNQRPNNYTDDVFDVVAEFKNGKMVPNDNILHLLFSFTGVGASMLVSTISSKKIYKLIYAIEFSHTINMISLNTCKCNMGHCCAITSVELKDTCKTVGELFAILGEPPRYLNPGDFSDYYEHPDSFILMLKEVRELPKYGGHSETEPLKTFPLKADSCYFMMDYYR